MVAPLTSHGAANLVASKMPPLRGQEKFHESLKGSAALQPEEFLDVLMPFGTTKRRYCSASVAGQNFSPAQGILPLTGGIFAM